MSNSTNSELYTNAKFTQKFVGGVDRPNNETKYINTQLNLLKAADKNVPPNVRQDNKESNKTVQTDLPSSKNVNNTKNDSKKKVDVYLRNDEDRYDPYIGFLYKKGLLDDGHQKRRFTTNYLNVDSSFRIKEPSLTIGPINVLTKDPLSFTQNSNIVTVTQPNHNFEVGDLITIVNIVGKQAIVRTYDSLGNPSFIIPVGTNVMKIFYNHGLPSTFQGSIPIQLAGIKGDRGSIQTTSFLGSIPVNLINAQQNLIVDLDPADPSIIGAALLPAGFLTPGIDHFYIVLPKAMTVAYVLNTYNFTIIYLSIAGVPLNLLNAQYPIDPAHLQGYQRITATTQNTYSFQIPQAALLKETGGGVVINVANVLQVNTGYPNANNYSIDLGQTYNNIVSVKMIDLQFPNTQQAIQAYPDSQQNNMLYWNDIDDGDYLYSIALPPGSYTPDQMVTELQNLFFATPRINSGTNIGSSYLPNHLMKVTIDTITNKVSFASYKESVLVQPIINITPEINPDASIGADIPGTIYTLTIHQPGHGMAAAGEHILISNAIDTMGIPSSVINQEQVVSKIIDANTYQIILPQFNLLSVRNNTMGGAAVTILIPDVFRLRFDKPNTLGQILGFRNVGAASSITKFGNVVTNQDPYQFDPTTDITTGQPIIYTNNSLQLSGINNYVHMIADPLISYNSVGPVKEGFCKILLCDLSGKILMNNNSSMTLIYDSPLRELSDLNIAFYNPDGSLFNFLGLDHAFTIEIVTVADIPEGSGVDSSSGKNYNLNVS